jgi:hypothetical protein
MRAYKGNFEERHIDKSDWSETHYYANMMHQALRLKHRPMGLSEAEILDLIEPF